MKILFNKFFEVLGLKDFKFLLIIAFFSYSLMQNHEIKKIQKQEIQKQQKQIEVINSYYEKSNKIVQEALKNNEIITKAYNDRINKITNIFSEESLQNDFLKQKIPKEIQEILDLPPNFTNLA